MNTQVQIKISLTSELQNLLKSKASKFGVPLTQYVKHVLMKDVEDDYPVYNASKATQDAVKDAIANLDKAVELKDIRKYFKEL